MTALRLFRSVCLVLSCAGLLLPGGALEAATPQFAGSPQETPQRWTDRTPDVELDAAGWMHGQALDAQRRPLADAAVTLHQAGRPIARGRTDASGRFQFGPLRGGAYQLVAGGRGVLVRAWAAGTAPPACHRVAVIAAGGGELVRGQMPFEEFFASDAVIICGLVAAMIAIPLAINHSRPHSP